MMIRSITCLYFLKTMSTKTIEDSFDKLSLDITDYVPAMNISHASLSNLYTGKRVR